MKQQRFLVNFDTKNIRTVKYDVIIIGSGIAGVYTALSIDESCSVAIITKESIDISNSVLAQGGIAVSLDKTDSPDLHSRDTLYAGAGLCDQDAVWVLVNEAEHNINHLFKYGVNFDKAGDSSLSLGREGAHSKNRILHAGDSTGKEILDKLISVVKTKTNVDIKERTFAIDLLTSTSSKITPSGPSEIKEWCSGVIAHDEDTGEMVLYVAPVIICATGGYGQVYEYTTNPEVATGDGLCLAFRAGVELMDLEFVQFHPTVLFHPDNRSFLISEAVRGEGAILKNKYGKRFMPEYHELAELAPRDIVSRAIFEEMRRTSSTHVYLDITFKDKESLENRFPNIYRTCMSYGIDISKDYIPVAPAEHYCMGGIRTDVDGRTNLSGFFAVGEAACNGIHGANRLASNSLLEGIVFGNRIAEQINKIYTDGSSDSKSKTELKPLEKTISYYASRQDLKIDIEKTKKEVQHIMTDKVGIIRDDIGLEWALGTIDEYVDRIFSFDNSTVDALELQNLLLLSRLVVESAQRRRESRGAHYRKDYPYTDDSLWQKNIIVSNKTAGQRVKRDRKIKGK